MKICVVGAGAIGGMLGVKFARAGHTVTQIFIMQNSLARNETTSWFCFVFDLRQRGNHLSERNE